MAAAPLQRILHLDRRMLLGVRRLHARPATVVMRALTRMGDAPAWFLYGGLLLACGARVAGLRLGVAAVLATVLSFPLKRLFTRPRPDRAIHGFEALAANPDHFSFPSGHAATAMAVAIALAGCGHGLGVAALSLALGVACSRVYLGAHYPLDVSAGALLGVVAGALSRLLI